MQLPPFDWVAFWTKLRGLLQSRKFWALVTALVATGAGYFTGELTAVQTVVAVVAALSAYSIATGIEDSGQAHLRG